MEENEFNERQREVKNLIGYKAFFVDNNQHGHPVEAYFLMEDGRLVVFKYKPVEIDGEPEQYTSAREFMQYNKWKLDKAKDDAAIKQLADYLNNSN